MAIFEKQRCSVHSQKTMHRVFGDAEVIVVSAKGGIECLPEWNRWETALCSQDRYRDHALNVSFGRRHSTPIVFDYRVAGTEVATASELNEAEPTTFAASAADASVRRCRN
mmetsp:Transcript_38109/g.80719  ORF Transcript_38109/g.80719 Transcript_38109/m.80719 type:complete len:111 (-) Transcript_38109:53-385(-)